MSFEIPWKEETEIQEEKENICGQCGEEIPLEDWETKPIVKCPFCGTYKNNPAIIESDEKYAPIPQFNLRWLRFQERINFTSKAQLFLALGMKGAGKSSLLEAISIRYAKIIDLYGSSDNESLSYLKPEFSRVWRSIHGSDPSVLLVTGQNKDVASNISKFNTCRTEELNLKIIEENDVITTSELFFDSEDEYFTAIGTIVTVLWKQRNSWTVPFFVLVREAGNWIYSRNKVIKNDGVAKAEFIKSMREARHHGLACLPLNEQIITSNGNITIEDFVKKDGGSVLSDNNRKFEFNYALPFFKGFQKLNLIITDKGTFRATNEHPFYTGDGWKKVSELQVGQKLHILKDIPKLSDENKKINYKRPLFYLLKRGPFSGTIDYSLKAQALKSGVNIHFQETLAKNEANIIATGPTIIEAPGMVKGIVFKTDIKDIAILAFNNKLAFKGYSYLLVTKGYGCLCSVVMKDEASRINWYFERTKDFFLKKIPFQLQIIREVSGIGSFSLKKVKSRVPLYVGEAAGLQDFLWGFGMRFAFASGYLAAQSVICKTDYEKIADKHFRNRLRAGIINRWLIENILSKKDYSALVNFPQLIEKLYSIQNYNLLLKTMYPLALFSLKKRYLNLRS